MIVSTRCMAILLQQRGMENSMFIGLYRLMTGTYKHHNSLSTGRGDTDREDILKKSRDTTDGEKKGQSGKSLKTVVERENTEGRDGIE